MFAREFIQENRCICYLAINPFKDSHVMRTAGNVNGKPSGPCHNPWGYVCAGWSDCCGNSVFVRVLLGCSSIYPTCALALAWGPGVGQSCVCSSLVLTLLRAAVWNGNKQDCCTPTTWWEKVQILSCTLLYNLRPSPTRGRQMNLRKKVFDMRRS